MNRSKASGADLEKLAALLAAIPYARFLGVTDALMGERATTVLPFSAHLVGNTQIPALHGGVIGAFMELAALAELTASQPAGRRARTIDVTVEYLRPARAMTTFAQADVRKLGRRIANVRVEAWQDDRVSPVAALRGHFLLDSPEGRH